MGTKGEQSITGMRPTAQNRRAIFIVKDTFKFSPTIFANDRPVRSFSSVLLTILILGAIVSATPVGELRGTVLDPMGAAVERANVQLMRGDSNVATTVTDDSGEFYFGSLQPGRYRVRAIAGG